MAPRRHARAIAARIDQRACSRLTFGLRAVYGLVDQRGGCGPVARPGAGRRARDCLPGVVGALIDQAWLFRPRRTGSFWLDAPWACVCDQHVSDPDDRQRSVRLIGRFAHSPGQYPEPAASIRQQPNARSSHGRSCWRPEPTAGVRHRYARRQRPNTPEQSHSCTSRSS